MYQYQKTNRYFAQVADDIKDIAEQEIISLGAENTEQVYCGIHFTADQKSLYRINYRSALITRVLAPLLSFECPSDDFLYQTAYKVHWEDFLKSTDTFAVFASVTQSEITHSHFAALRLKDAIADYYREKYGQRPSVDTLDPDIWINLHIEHNEAVISFDTSRGSLHRRGYRVKSVTAPMIETLAASIIRLSEWDCTVPLYDPFCGSGTLLTEAYIKAAYVAPAFLRKKFGFEKLTDFNLNSWSEIKTEHDEQAIPKGLISGSDKSQIAVNIALRNCEMVDKERKIEITTQNIFDIKSLEGKIIITNPSYGIRLDKDKDLSVFYKNFGDFLKQRCKGSTAFIYFGDRKYIKNMGLKSSWKKELSNGGLDGRLVKYELY